MKGVDLVDFMGGMLGDMRDRTEQGWQDVSAIRAELEKTRTELEHTRRELSDYKFQQSERYQSDTVQHSAERASDNRRWKIAFAVSTFLAVAALIVSIVSLLK